MEKIKDLIQDIYNLDRKRVTCLENIITEAFNEKCKVILNDKLSGETLLSGMITNMGGYYFSVAETEGVENEGDYEEFNIAYGDIIGINMTGKGIEIEICEGN